MLTFESPYNYNPSSLNITLNENEPENNSDIDKIADSTGEKALRVTGNPKTVALLSLLTIAVGGLKRRI